MNESPQKPPSWPTYVIAASGVILTLGALVWLGATYDSHGNPLLDDTVAKVLVGLTGGALTAVAALGQKKLGRIEHEVKPNHGSSMADGVNRTESVVVELAEQVGKMMANQQIVQRDLARLKSIPAEIAGLRKDVGRQATTDQQTHEDVSQLRKDFSNHVQWSQDQADKVARLERRHNEGKRP